MARIYSLPKGSNFAEEVLKIAGSGKIKTARIEAIGGVNHLKVLFFNHHDKKYEEHVFDEFLEVTGILGNITIKDGKPYLHAHGTFGRKDLSVIGGHIADAAVFPILEVVITPTSNVALRRFDDEIGLNVIYKTN